MIVRCFGSIISFISWMIGVDIASPTFSRPRENKNPCAVPVSITPSSCGCSLIAPVGQTILHRPQPWQRSLYTRIFFPMMAMALNSHALAHSPQRVHSSSSTSGRSFSTERVCSICGLRKMCAFGSSTSQSRNCTENLSETAIARFVATVVLPVPPFPLAIVILMVRPYVMLPCASARGTSPYLARSLSRTENAKETPDVSHQQSVISLQHRSRSPRLIAHHSIPQFAAPACHSEPGRPLHEDAPAFIVTRHSLPSCERHRLFPTPARCCSLKPQRPQRDSLDSCLTNHHAFLGVLCVFA